MNAGGNARLIGLRWLLPVAVAALVLLTVQFFNGRRQTEFPELVPIDGVLDITAVDLDNQVFGVSNNWAFYPNRLYTPQDFVSGTALDSRETGEARYGTYRLVIRAKPDQYYTLCSYSIDYSTTVFVNGRQILTFGTVADNAGESEPGIGYMTLPLYTGTSGELEIIYHYANFVHRDGGFIQPTYLSTPENIEAYKAGNDLVSLGLSGGMVILCLYFLLCGAVQRRAVFCLLAVCCLLIALRDQNFLLLHLLPPNTSWYFSYRLFISVSALLPGLLLLLLNSIYTGAVKRQIMLLYALIMAAAVALIILLPTIHLALICSIVWVLGLPVLGLLIWGAVRGQLRKKCFEPADILTAGGSAVLVVSVVLEGALVNSSSAVSRYGVAPSGMLVFILLVAVSVGLRSQRQEAALIESRSRSQLLEQMNSMHLDFFHQVAHELKTPLTVISGYAQLTGLQLAAGHITGETAENLKTIQTETLRLAEMVTRLMEYSYGQHSGTQFGTVEVAPLLESVQAVCTPMCLKNNNRIVVQGADCADIYGSRTILLQVFINLVVNANRHTSNGTITISASDQEHQEYVVFRTADTGSGIAPEHLPHLFEKGYSGDGSSGLGLSICREAVEAHGGMLEIEHTGPAGTVFAFTALRKERENNEHSASGGG